MSGLVSALAGVLYAARLGAVRASTARGIRARHHHHRAAGRREHLRRSRLDGRRAALDLPGAQSAQRPVIAGITGNTQTGVIGLLLILSVLMPNLAARAQDACGGGRPTQAMPPPGCFRRRALERPRTGTPDDRRCPASQRGHALMHGSDFESTKRRDRVKKRRSFVVSAAVGALMLAIGQPWLRRRLRSAAAAGDAAVATPGQDVKMMLLPKFLGILPFDQANQGAQEAAAELENPTALDFVGPTAENSVAGQIEFVTNAPAGGYDVVMLSNNSGDQIVPAVAGRARGRHQGGDLGLADPERRGRVASSWRRSTSTRPARSWPTWPARSSARTAASSPSCRRPRTRRTRMPGSRRWRTALEDPKYANLELLETVYGDDQSEKSYEQAQALIDKYPDMELIMAPTSVGIVAAAKALQDEGLCDDDQGLRSGRAGGDARVHAERLRAGVRALELRRPRLPDLLRLVPAGDRRRSRASRARPSRRAAWASTRSPRTRPGRTSTRCAILMGPFSVYNIDNVEPPRNNAPLDLTAEYPRPSEPFVPGSGAFELTMEGKAGTATQYPTSLTGLLRIIRSH